jgi:hypothetical protein
MGKNTIHLKTFTINYCSAIYKHFTIINKILKKE